MISAAIEKDLGTLCSIVRDQDGVLIPAAGAASPQWLAAHDELVSVVLSFFKCWTESIARNLDCTPIPRRSI
jgi:hypothetical protein